MVELEHSQLIEKFRLIGKGDFRLVQGLASSIHRAYWQAHPEVQKMVAWTKDSRTQASKCARSPSMPATQTVVKLEMDKKRLRAQSSSRNFVPPGSSGREETISAGDEMEPANSIRMIERLPTPALCPCPIPKIDRALRPRRRTIWMKSRTRSMSRYTWQSVRLIHTHRSRRTSRWAQASRK